MNADGLLFIHDVRMDSLSELLGVEAYTFLASIDGKLINTVTALCTYLEAAQATGRKVRLITRQADWEYRSQTTYRSYEINVADVRLVGPRAPDGCH